MMAKAANGICLLANYNLMEPCAVPLDLNCKISIRLHLIGVRERLEAKPVKEVAALLRKQFGADNPWFAEKMQLTCNDPKYTTGYQMLFNL